jgi:hypothetical protein
MTDTIKKLQEVREALAYAASYRFGDGDVSHWMQKNLATLDAVIARMGWQPIETAPAKVSVLLYCPERGITNNERIELGWADSGSGSYHAWATHWMHLPTPPTGEPK